MWLAFFFGSLHTVSELVQSSRVGTKTLLYKVGPNEDVKNLNRGYCDASI